MTDDRYPSTEDEQSVHLDVAYPDASARRLPRYYDHRLVVTADMANTSSIRPRSAMRLRSILGTACLAASLAFALPAAPAPADGPAPVVLDARSGCGPALDTQGAEDCVPSTAAAYDGWSAWSRADPATGQFELVTRSPAGVISTPAVRQRAAPFDVELGPHGSSVVAVYSRCANALTDAGCGIYELPLPASPSSERRLDIPGGGSVHEPAIWNGIIVFLRRDDHGNEDVYSPQGARPDSLLEWQGARRKPSYLSLPHSRGVKGSPSESGWPRGLTGVISGLTLNGSSIAYTTAVADGDFSMSTLWLQQLGHAPRLIDQVAAGAGNVCDPRFLSPVIDRGWLYAYLHDCPAGGGPLGDDRFTRYSVSGDRAERADHSFIHHIDDQIFSVVPYDDGVIWDNGAVDLLARLTWRPLARPVPATFCTRADAFC